MCHYGLTARPKVVLLCLPDQHHAKYVEQLKLMKKEETEALSCRMGGCHMDFRPHNPVYVKKTQ